MKRAMLTGAALMAALLVGCSSGQKCKTSCCGSCQGDQACTAGCCDKENCCGQCSGGEAKVCAGCSDGKMCDGCKSKKG